MAFAASIPSQVSGLLLPPGTPVGPGGSGGVASPGSGSGWEVYVYDADNFADVLCRIPDTMLQSFQFSDLLDDLGSGNVVLSMDDPWWTSTHLGNGSLPNEILDFECLWQFRQDGVPRFEFMGETVTEQLTDSSEQRIVTITGPGTISTLKWGMCAPPGFPSIVLKMDGIQDSFSEVDVNGNPVLNTNVWNSVSPTANVYITPAGHLYNYPGGAGYALATLYPSGSVTLKASTGTTFLGATPYDATDTLISAQVSPIGLNNATGSYNVASLDGSQLTQFYIQSNLNSNYYALFGLSSTAFYCKVSDPTGTFTKVLKPYNPSNHAYWMITEQAGSNGNNGTFYFWTSPDGQNWTKEWQYVHTFDATNMAFYYTAFYDVNGAVSAQLTNLNSNVTTPSYQGVIYLGVPIFGVWADQYAKAQQRGTIPFITTTASAGSDSFGNLWTDASNVQTVNGTDLYSLLQATCNTLNADYHMLPGFELRVGQAQNNTPGIGIDRHKQVVFRDGRTVVSRMRTRMRNQIQNLIGAENQDGHEISAQNSSSITSWLQREAWYHTAAQVDPTSMAFAAAAAAASNAFEVASQTLQILPGQPGRTVYQSFGVGDWVGLERPDFSAVDSVRAVGISVQVDVNGVETNELTLLTYVQWLEQQLTYVQTRMGGGFVNTPGLTPVAPSKYGTGQVPTYFDPAASMQRLADVNQAVGSVSAAPMVYNPSTSLWQPAGTADPVTGNPVPLTLTGPGGTTSLLPGSLSLLASGPQVAPDGGGSLGPQFGIYANSNGLFFYNGTPGPGTLIGSIAYTAGNDGNGNSYAQGINFGTWSGGGVQQQHFQVDDSGNVAVVNSAGKTVAYIASANGTVLVYNSSGVGAGNLVGSMSPVGRPGAAVTDSAGNQVYEGVTAYVPYSGVTYAVGLNSLGVPGINYPGLSIADVAHPPTAPAGVFGVATNGTSPGALAVLSSGSANGTDAAAALYVESKLAGATPGGLITMFAGQIALGAGAGVSGNPTFAMTSGQAGYLPVVQTDTSVNPNANVIGAHQVTVAWTIDATDAQAGTVYEIEVPFDGTFENQTLTFSLSIDGSATGLAQATIGAGFFPAGTSFNGTIRVKLQVITAGVSGTVKCFSDGGLGITGTRSSGVNNNDTYLSGRDLSQSLDTTVVHNIRVNTTWGGSTAGQVVTGYGSKFTRSGP